MFTSTGSFLLRRSDEVIASKVALSKDYGIYHVGADLGRLPVSELGPVMMRAFLPVLSSIQSNVERTNDAVLKTMSAINIITIPVGLGIAVVAVPLTSIVLGDKWIEAAPFVAIYAVVAAVQFISSPLTTLLVLRGYTKVQSFVIWIEFVVFICLAYFLMPQYALVGLALSRLLASFISTGAIIYLSRKLCFVNIKKIVFSIFRPLTGSIVMGALVIGLTNLMEASLQFEFIASSVFGAFIYSLWIYFTWLIFKRPEGLESTIIDFLKSKNFKY